MAEYTNFGPKTIQPSQTLAFLVNDRRPLPAHRVGLLRAFGNPIDLYGVTYLAGLGETQSGDTGDTRLSARAMGLLLTLASSDVLLANELWLLRCDNSRRGIATRYNHVFLELEWCIKGPRNNNFSGLMFGVNRLEQLRCQSPVRLIPLSLWVTLITPLYDQEVAMD